MDQSVTELAGWIPAIILPTAALLQLHKLVVSKSTDGVSLASWLLFAVANVGLYIFTEKYAAPQALIGLLGTALINFAIVAAIVVLRRRGSGAASRRQSDD